MAIIRVTNVPTSALADDVITSAKISDGTIAVSDLADNAITTAKIADANVTPAKLQTGVDFTINSLTVGKGNNSVVSNTALGVTALGSAGTGTQWGTAVGYNALALATGNGNTAVGYLAGYSTTTASSLVALGMNAAFNNTTGLYNVALGREALYNNTTSNSNIAIGYAALFDNTGSANIAIGTQALRFNTASNNVAVGYQALFNNTTGTQNTAVGYKALYYNEATRDYNTAVGYEALFANTSGEFNTAVGRASLDSNTTGYFNTAVGDVAFSAVTTGVSNTAIGRAAGNTLTTGSNNTLLGFDAEPSSATVSNEITLGNASVNKVRMGNGDILYNGAGISGQNLFINGAMQVWQRGTSFNVTSTQYTADRWKTLGQIWTGARSTDAPDGFHYSLDITSGSGSYGTFGQRIEAVNCKHLVGKTVTLSFYAKAVSGATNCYIVLSAANAEDNWTSSTSISQPNISDIGSTWTRHSFTFTNLPSSVANGITIALFHGIGQTTQRRYTGLQLEIGDTATPFEHRPYDMEWQRCMRYYQQFNGSSQWACQVQPNISDTQYRILSTSVLPVPIRNFQATVSIPANTTNRGWVEGGNVRTSIGFINSNNGLLQIFTNYSGTDLSAYSINISGKITIDAEL